MTHPIVFRVSATSKAPDFDVFEINEETNEERFIGYVMVPRLDHTDEDKPIRLHVLKTDGTLTDESLPYSTPWSEATQLMYMKLLFNIEGRHGQWLKLKDCTEPARVSLKHLHLATWE